MDRIAPDPPYMSTVVKPTPDHLKRLPYGFQDLEIFYIEPADKWSYYAKWEGKSVSSSNLSDLGSLRTKTEKSL